MIYNLLPVQRFEGKIKNIKCGDFRKQLDYKITNKDKKRELLNNMLYDENGELNDFHKIYFDKYYKYNINRKEPLSHDINICKELHYLGRYLAVKDKNEVRRKYDKYKKKQKNEIVTGDIEKLLETQEKRKAEKANYDLNPIAEYREEYAEMFPEAKEYLDMIKAIQKKIRIEKDINNKKKMAKQLSLLKDDFKYVCESKLGTFKFNSVGFSKSEINWDSDTGYYDENDEYHYVSYNFLEFSNQLHIYELIRNYKELYLFTEEDTQSDMKYILVDLDNLIEKTQLEDYERDIVEWTKQQHSNKWISDELEYKHKKTWTDSQVSKHLRNQLCKRISEQYSRDYENWFYTYKAKGDYKQCSKCGKIKLANENYYFWDTANKRLRSHCKECHNT